MMSVGGLLFEFQDYVQPRAVSCLVSVIYEYEYDMLPWEDELERYGFTQKECCLFVPTQQQEEGVLIANVRCFCGEVLCQHADFSQPECSKDEIIEKIVPAELRDTFAPDNWEQNGVKITKNYKYLWQNPFRTSPTNACGKVHFSSTGDVACKPAKYIRVSNEDSAERVWSFMKSAWRTVKPKPDLVVSVVGGAENFRLEGLSRDKIQNGLLKIAETTHPMFISSGLNVGIMKTLGQIMKEGQSYSISHQKAIHNIRCLAISPWGYVLNRNTMEKRSSHVKYRMCKRVRGDYQPIPLNPYHTHFVLVDNGFRNRFTECGNIAKYRAVLEKQINSESPIVLVVVEGGYSVFLDINHSLAEGIPVVICNGTGRAADLMAYFVSRSDERGELSLNYLQKLKVLMNKLYGKTWSDPAVRQENLDELTTIVCRCVRCKERITVYDINEQQGLDFYILSALLRGNRGSGYRTKELELAISLNRPDIAELDLFGENVNWPIKTLHSTLQSCIVKNLDGFVRLVIQQENFDMTTFLTKAKLLEIYREALSQNPNTVFSRLASGVEQYRENRDEICLYKIGGVLESLLDCYDRSIYNSPDIDEELHDPYLQLYIWAVLNERWTLADLFWECVDAPIASALLGSWLCYKMSNEVGPGEKEWRDNLLLEKQRMEDLAVQILNRLQSRYPKQALHCVEKDKPLWGGITTLQIAAAADAKKFLSSATCQDSLTSQWVGQVKMRLWKVVVILPLTLILPCFMGRMGQFRQPTKDAGWTTKFAEFFCSPRVKFMNDTISYGVFLLMFTYLILFQVRDEVSVLEWVCVFWALAIFMDELHRLICVPAMSKRSLLQLWRGWLYLIYLISLLAALIALVIHLFTRTIQPSGKIYAINAVFFYLRLLRFYTASEHLGPKLHIIKSTLRPLGFFGAIALVFLLAYGVPSQALMIQKRDPYWGIFFDIVYMPYWQVYGELQLESFETDETCVSNLAEQNITDVSSCRQFSRIVPAMLAVYLFFANVLLLNLIIAIFTKIFENVESNSVEIWKYQMYFFINEYKIKSVLPAPFSVLEDTYRIVRHAMHCCCGVWAGHKAGLSKGDERHLRWVERQVTDRLLRKMKEKEAISGNKSLYTIEKSVKNFLSTLISDLDVIGKSGARDSMRFVPATQKTGERWLRLIHERILPSRAKKLTDTNYETNGDSKIKNRKSENSFKDTVENGLLQGDDSSEFDSESD